MQEQRFKSTLSRQLEGIKGEVLSEIKNDAYATQDARLPASANKTIFNSYQKSDDIHATPVVPYTDEVISPIKVTDNFIANELKLP